MHVCQRGVVMLLFELLMLMRMPGDNDDDAVVDVVVDCPIIGLVGASVAERFSR